jgi:ankyrin repeat protein
MSWGFWYWRWRAALRRRTPGEALARAIYAGDAGAVVRWLNRGADPNARLHQAMQTGNLEIVRLLVEHGADVNVRGIDSSEFEAHWWATERTPLMIAAKRGDIPVVRYLLDRGADPNLGDDRGRTALFFAVSPGVVAASSRGPVVTWGHPAVVSVLLEHGADVNARSHAGCTALHTAATFGEVDLVRTLIGSGCDVHAQDERGNTALMCAASSLTCTPPHCHTPTATVEALLECGADRDLENHAGRTAWLLALEHRAQPPLDLLKPTHVDPNRAVGSRLIGAVRRDDVIGVRELLQAGADPNMRDSYGTPPLISAAGSGRTEIVRALLEHGADANARRPEGRTALIEAASSYDDYLDVVKLLLQHGADVNLQDEMRTGTPLMCAASRGHISIIAVLLAAGADVNAKVPEIHTTALYTAALYGQVEAVRVLLAHGADVHARRADGETALHRARAEGYREIVALLKHAGARR